MMITVDVIDRIHATADPNPNLNPNPGHALLRATSRSRSHVIDHETNQNRGTSQNPETSQNPGVDLVTNRVIVLVLALVLVLDLGLEAVVVLVLVLATAIVVAITTVIADLDLGLEAVAVATVEVTTATTEIEIGTTIDAAMIVDPEATLATPETNRARSFAGTTSVGAVTGRHAVSHTETVPLSRIRTVRRITETEGEVRRCVAITKTAAARAGIRASSFMMIAEADTGTIATAAAAAVVAMVTATEELRIKLLRRTLDCSAIAIAIRRQELLNEIWR